MTAAKTAMRLVQIAPGVEMPILGYGTWQVTDREKLRAGLDSALKSGYRFIDTAGAYGNEKDIGEFLRELLPKYGLERKDIFITSKMRHAMHGKGTAREAGLLSNENLGFGYIDLYLIHFPGTAGLDPKDALHKKNREDSWLELEKLKKEGVFRAIGVSNYMENHLGEMPSYSSTPPAVNQVEYHPHLAGNRSLVKYCQDKGIHFQAYSSLGSDKSSELLAEPIVGELAKKYSCSKPQLLLAWAMAQDISVLPRSNNASHVADNLKAVDVKMESADVEKIAGLGIKGARYCWDPTVIA